jgi:hypothetical protein
MPCIWHLSLTWNINSKIMPLISKKEMLQFCHLWFWLMKIKLVFGLIFRIGSRSRIYSCNALAQVDNNKFPFDQQLICSMSCSNGRRHAQVWGFGLGVGFWLTIQLVFLTFQLFSPIFSTTFCTRLRLPHPLIVNILWSVCTHLIDPTSIHFLRCVHDNERIKTHEAICDTFGAIARDASFHVGWKQLHELFLTTFNSSRQWIDIVFTKDGIHTLINVVIVDQTWVDLFLRSCATQGFVAFDLTQAKEKELSQPTTHWSIPPLSNWNICLLT